MQRYLLQTICRAGKPMTFAELRRCAIDPQIGFLSSSEERSLGRALRGLVRDKVIVAFWAAVGALIHTATPQSAHCSHRRG
jgi:hypothetical protein